MLKDFACSPENSRGRVYLEKPTPYRNEFERDRDRIIHSNAFKRLQYKTQVFINHKGDHYRNRLTHSIEVSTIARSVSKALGLCADLAEAIALAHDLGHTPFGHAGEEALDFCMKDFGGFSHNAHSFKILTLLEQKYAAFDGLNLNWEVLEGIIKHNGPLKMSTPYAYVFDYDKNHDLNLSKHSSAESQVAALADDIAYICHDLEDGIKAGIINYEDLKEVEFVDQYIQEVKNMYPNINDDRLIYELGRKIMHYFIEDLLAQTRANIEKYNIKTEYDIRNLGHLLVWFSDYTSKEVKLIKDFLMKKVYKHHRVVSVTLRCQNVIKDLFKLYAENIELLPFEWRKAIDENNIESKMLIITNYIAGMTDRFAIKQHRLFYNLNFESKDL